MFLTGIIAEFNPLHSGHEFLISKAKQNGGVVCVLSSNFVQRGEAAIYEKEIRVKAAIKAGVDLVLELPVIWSMSTAQNFALGGVSILDSVGCNNILFGSEAGNIHELNTLCDILYKPEFNDCLKEQLKKGVTFAAAREKAVEIIGGKSELLKGANNNLGIEYICSARNIGSSVNFETVKRIGASHDSKNIGDTVSASLLREKLREENYEFCTSFIREDILKIFIENSASHAFFGDRAVLSVLRTKTLEDFKLLPDISEGVENKLYSSVKLAKSLDELYNKMKVKRYTLARIRRLIMSAFLGIDKEFFMKTPPYVRVLGFNKNGEKILKEIKGKTKIPLITRVGEIDSLSQKCKKIFETECRATDLYSMFLKEPFDCGLEYKRKLIKEE